MKLPTKIKKDPRSQLARQFTALPDQQFDHMVDKLEEGMIPINTLKAYYRSAIMEVETKFRVLNEQFNIEYDENPIESIKTRIKSDSSILKKLKRKNLPLSIESIENNIYDVAGVRVITSFQKDIYLLADCLLQQDDIFLIERKDYIQNPKPNGYRSLHLIVEVPIFLSHEKRMMKVEVQLRTIAMDFWASLEHRLRYKKNLSEDVLNEITLELYDCAKTAELLDQKMQDVYDIVKNEQTK